MGQVKSIISYKEIPQNVSKNKSSDKPSIEVLYSMARSNDDLSNYIYNYYGVRCSYKDNEIIFSGDEYDYSTIDKIYAVEIKRNKKVVHERVLMISIFDINSFLNNRENYTKSENYFFDKYCDELIRNGYMYFNIRHFNTKEAFSRRMFGNSDYGTLGKHLFSISDDHFKLKLK